MHERLVFELLGIRERITGNVTRKALSSYQDTAARLHSSDEVNMHKAPLRSAHLLPFFLDCPVVPVQWNQLTRSRPLRGIGQRLTSMSFSM